VAILKDGVRVAQAPIQQLLAGSGGVAFELTLRGDDEAARQRLLGQSWTSDVELAKQDGIARLLVTVSDERAAERDLLRVVLTDIRVDVLSFTPKRSQLEDIFLELVEKRTP
jgi:hypothetical protein